MIHYGDICKIKGDEVPVVNIIVGGSPCQDLSIAGNRAGLDGARSGLYMEQIRIIKEMRLNNGKSRTNDVCGPCGPRFMVWENVPGAFTTNDGGDFRSVIEEAARIADPTAVIPGPPNGWTNSGCVLGNGWSIAWRVHDAQFWGVPQRRRRIALVTDFGGYAAPEILFEREGVPGNLGQGEQEGKRNSATVGTGIEKSSAITFRKGKHPKKNEVQKWEGAKVSDTLNVFDNTETRTPILIIQPPVVFGNHSQDTRYKQLKNICEPVTHLWGTGGNNQPFVVCVGNGQLNNLKEKETAGTLNCMHDQQSLLINESVRRLTPLECERLQGFPDGWTDINEWTDSQGKKHKCTDTARYKALGNSIALPFWQWLAGRMVDVLKADGVSQPTMASLFDGIGGFPLVFSRCGCVPVWASEVEEFPIAVTKRHFPESEDL